MGGDSNQSKGKSWPKKSERESDLKGYRLVDANCMTFWKRRNYGEQQRDQWLQGGGLGRAERKRQGMEGFSGRENTL